MKSIQALTLVLIFGVVALLLYLAFEQSQQLSETADNLRGVDENRLPAGSNAPSLLRPASR